MLGSGEQRVHKSLCIQDVFSSQKRNHRTHCRRDVFAAIEKHFYIISVKNS